MRRGSGRSSAGSVTRATWSGLTPTPTYCTPPGTGLLVCWFLGTSSKSDLAANLRAFENHRIRPDSTHFFLPPYEHFTEEIARWTKEGGRVLVNMTPGTRSNTDYMTDDDPRFIPARAIVASIIQADQNDPDGLNGYLLLMHLVHGPARSRDHLHDELPALLDKLCIRGYGFVRVDELLSSEYKARRDREASWARSQHPRRRTSRVEPRQSIRGSPKPWKIRTRDA